jgi:hypothetical protein
MEMKDAIGQSGEAPVRSIGSLVGLLVVAATVGLIYRYYFSQNQQAAPISHPTQTIDVIGVRNDLLGMAQAERIYQTQHSGYGSLDDLVSSGAMTVKKSGRDGYTYEAEVSTESFRIIAHCPRATQPGCTNYFIDQTMEVQAAP